MKRDIKQNQRLAAFAETCGFKWKERVKYQTTSRIDASSKKGVMILDEADTIVFNDLPGFHSNTNYKNLRVIGLTATPYSGSEDGVEATALEMMRYAVYKNNSSMKVEDPEIDVRVKLGSLDKWKEQVE